jgi:6-phosphogluconolactonase
MTDLPPGTEVLPDPDALARAAAEILIAQTAVPDPAICLSGGSTPKRLYQLLCTPAYAGRMPWDRIHWFWGDERFVPSSDPDSNERMAREAMLAHVPVPPDHIHPIPTVGLALEDAAAAYGRALRAFAAARPGRPLFDLALMGLGDDGHTASLFPGKPAIGETHHWAVGVPEAGLAPFVPRITLTLPAFAESALILFLAEGAKKAPTLRRVAAGEDLPSARITTKGTLRWLVDRAAAGE